MKSEISAYLESVSDAARRVDPAAVEACILCLESAWREGRGVFVIGNGGSAASASHLAQDLSKGALPDFPETRRFRVLSLTDNTSFITALANDIGFERVFELQLRQFAQPGDVLIAISGSGNSPSIVRALDAAAELGLTIIGVSGFDGGILLQRAAIRVHVPLRDMCKSEAVHGMVLHAVVDLLRGRLRQRPA